MGELQAKNFSQPDERLRHPGLDVEIVVIGELYVGRYLHQPGWSWSRDMKPGIGTPSCEHHHQGYVISGALRIIMDNGAERTLVAGDVFEIPPGHDAEVVGNEPCSLLMFRGVRDWGRAPISGERVLTTILFTDIVGSTAHAASIGDAAWRRLLASHADRVRIQLDRFRGHEINTTGDGFLATFESPARAAHCAAAICRTAREDGLEVRTGVHSGEVERFTDNIQGLAVHAAARVAALAGPGEVLLSGSTVALLEGSGLEFDDAGTHELKGLPGPRRLYRLKCAD